MCDNNAYVAYAGTGIAILCSLFKAPLSVTVVATVIAVYLLLLF